MQFTLDTAQLKSVIARLQATPGAVDSDPLQSVIKITADEFGTVNMERSTSSATISCDLDAVEIKQDGSLLVGSNNFFKLCSSLAGTHADFKKTGDCCVIKSGASNGRLPTAIGIFPNIHKNSEVIETIELPTDTFTHKLKNCMANTEKVLGSVLGGVTFRVHGKMLVIFASNRKVTVMYGTGIPLKQISPQAEGWDAGISMPPETCSAIMALMVDQKKINIQIREDYITVLTSGVKADLPLMAERPFNVEPAFNSLNFNEDPWIEFDRSELIKAIQSVSTMADKDTPKMAIKFNQENIELSCGINGSELSLAVPGQAKEAIEASFNPHYMINFLRSATEDACRLQFDSRSNSLYLKSKNEFHCVSGLRD